MTAPPVTAKAFLNSIPKAGAHLLTRALDLLGFREGTRPLGSSVLFGGFRAVKLLTRAAWSGPDLVVLGIELATPVRAGWVRNRLRRIGTGAFGRGHVRHSEAFARLLADLALASVHLVRDPRDVAVSHAHYVSAHRRHLLHRHYRSLGGWEERLAFSITGGPVPGAGYLESLAGRFRSMEPWLTEPSTVTLRFEDLVGEAGGGSAAAQRCALERLCNHLGVAPDPAVVERVANGLFGGTSTFRRGAIGAWREAFSAEHRALFARVAGELTLRWGYPDR